MAFIGEWLRRLNYLFRRRAMEDELRREMESHRELMNEPRRFGNTLQLRERSLQLRLRDPTAERAMLGTIDRVIREVDERVPVLRRETWRAHIYEGFSVWLFRTGARVFCAFGAIALLLAVIGVYGVKSYLVSRRTREFGIRIATGADPRALLWQVLREGSRTTIIGIGIGLVLALEAGQFLQGMLYRVNSC